MTASRFRTFALLAFLLLGTLMITACGKQDADAPAHDSSAPDVGTTAGNQEIGHTSAGTREFRNDDGSTVSLPARPQRILSTSVAITGTLLAIDAPVIASASMVNGTFFGQWAKVAAERGVENAWPAGSVDLETAYALKPDLIVVATSGADSAMPQLDELRRVAPTLVLDYGSHTWQELALRLGEALGLQDQVNTRIQDFDRHVAEAKARITVPTGQANIISFNGPAMNNPIAAPTGAHAQLLESLGFDIEVPDPSWHSGNAGQRGDFVWAPYEYLTRLTAPTTFLLRFGNDRIGGFLGDPVLANLPSVKSKQVYGLGENSFRIDYYSGTEIVDGIVATFGR